MRVSVPWGTRGGKAPQKHVTVRKGPMWDRRGQGPSKARGSVQGSHGGQEGARPLKSTRQRVRLPRGNLIFPPGRCHSTRSLLLSTVVAAPVQGCSATRERQKPDPMMDKAMGAMEAGKTRSSPQKQQQVSYLVVTAHPCALRNLDRDVAQTMPRSNRRRHISWQRLTHAC